MPITPQFHLTQSLTHVELSIRVPHVRVTAESIQVAIDNDQTLHFASPPYLLLLHFGPEQRFHVDAAEACAKYEPTIEDGTIFLTLKKETPGEWENLDLLGKWKQPSTKNVALGARWLREVMAEETEELNEDPTDNAAMDDNGESSAASYGFLRLFHGIYADLTRDGLAKEMLEMPWIEEATSSVLRTDTNAGNIREMRRQRRIELEREKFDPERFLQDLDVHEDYVYQCAMSHLPHWREDVVVPDVVVPDALAAQLANLSLENQSAFFTAEEQRQLMTIPYPLLPPTITDAERLVAGLVDMLFAYVYDHLTTSGEPTVESAWTVSTLSSALACLEDWLDGPSPLLLSQVGYTCLRRSLIYPYLRNFEFSCHCLEQVHQIMHRGVRCVIRCLLQLRSILDHSELYYLGNKLWVDPYLAWLQRDTERVEAILKRMAKDWPSDWDKEKVDLNLFELESRFAADGMTNDDESSSDDDSSSSSNEDEDSVNSHDNSEAENIPSTEALLDENVGQSILHVLSTESPRLDANQISKKHARPLIEEM